MYTLKSLSSVWPYAATPAAFVSPNPGDTFYQVAFYGESNPLTKINRELAEIRSVVGDGLRAAVLQQRYVELHRTRGGGFKSRPQEPNAAQLVTRMNFVYLLLSGAEVTALALSGLGIKFV